MSIIEKASFPETALLQETRNKKSETPPHLPLFPQGHFTLLLGEPGAGKSLLAAHLAMRHSLRSPFPAAPHAPDPFPSSGDIDCHPSHHPAYPGLALIFSAEDPKETTQYRLCVADAGASADLRFIQIHAAASLITPPPDSYEGLRLRPATPDRRESPLLRLLLDLNLPISLLILDPLPAFLENIDAAYNAALIRQTLAPLFAFTTRHGISVLGINHLNKYRAPKSQSPLHRAAGSYAYTALARSVLLFTQNPHPYLAPDVEPSPATRFLIPLKNNFAQLTHGYPLTIHSKTLDPDTDGTPGPLMPYLSWNDPIPLANAIQSSSAEPGACEKSRREFALHFLRTTLAAGPVPSAQLLQQARSLGIAQRTFDRARFQLQILCDRDTPTGRWFSSLPGHDKMAHNANPPRTTGILDSHTS